MPRTDGKSARLGSPRSSKYLWADARRRGYPAVLSGANADDVGDWRRGLRAAAEHGVVHPLLAASLRDARRPAAVRQVDRAELALKRLGYTVLRVRHYGELGRVELAADELERALARGGREAVEAAVRSAGYARVEIDEQPFRSGSLNRPFTKRLSVAR